MTCTPSLLDLGLADLRAEADVEALLLEFARGGLGDFGVGGGEEIRQRFEDGDFAPRRFHTLPSSRPITPAPITPRRFGTAVEVERADVVDDVLVVELRERQFDRIRTGGDDHVGAP